MYLAGIEIYNEQDQLDLALLLNKEKKIKMISEFFYDDDNKLTDIIHLNGQQKLKRQYLKNKVIMQSIRNNKVTSISIQELNTDNEVIDWVFLDESRDTIKRYEYEYDSAGNETFFSRTFKSFEKSSSRKTNYDEEGNLKSFKKYDYKGKLFYEIENMSLEYSKDENVLIRTRTDLHIEYQKKKSKTYETKTIDFIDGCNNIIKRYTNNGIGSTKIWDLIYLDMYYKEN